MLWCGWLTWCCSVLSHHFGVREGRRVGLVATIGEFYIDSISWQFVLDVLYLWYPGHLRCLFFMLPPFISTFVYWHPHTISPFHAEIYLRFHFCIPDSRKSCLWEKSNPERPLDHAADLAIQLFKIVSWDPLMAIVYAFSILKYIVSYPRLIIEARAAKLGMRGLWGIRTRIPGGSAESRCHITMFRYVIRSWLVKLVSPAKLVLANYGIWLWITIVKTQILVCFLQFLALLLGQKIPTTLSLNFPALLVVLIDIMSCW